MVVLGCACGDGERRVGFKVVWSIAEARLMDPSATGMCAQRPARVRARARMRRPGAVRGDGDCAHCALHAPALQRRRTHVSGQGRPTVRPFYFRPVGSDFLASAPRVVVVCIDLVPAQLALNQSMLLCTRRPQP